MSQEFAVLKPSPGICQLNTKPLTCDGRGCAPCNGVCKSRCGQNETPGVGICPRGCQCCQKQVPNPDGCKLMGKVYAEGTVFHENCMKFSCRDGKWVSSNVYNA